MNVFNEHDFNYKRLITEVLAYGSPRTDRTGTGTISTFSLEAKYKAIHGFPLLTTKKIHWKSVVGELLWFLSGSTNNNDLVEKYGVTIWNEWAKENGDLGPVYGAQWRNFHGNSLFTGRDQIKDLIESIKSNPFSRRHLVSAWNPNQIDQMALPPCHTLFQVYVHTNGTLDLKLYQRSADMFLGVPFNIASYSLLMYMIAHVTGYKPGTFYHSIGDAHIYNNHLDAVQTQLERSIDFESPTLELNPNIRDIFSFSPSDITLVNYNSHPTIKAPVAI